MRINEARRLRANASAKARNRAEKRREAHANADMTGIALGDEVTLRWDGFPGVPAWLGGACAKVTGIGRKRLTVEAIGEPGKLRSIARAQCIPAKKG
jgi:hypothetical protein